MTQLAELHDTNNPYQASATWQSQPEAEAFSEEAVSELRAFVGPRADYYLRKWAPRLRSPRGQVGMNWFAFLLPAIWLGYRKMYRGVFTLFGVLILVSIIEQVLFVGVLGRRASPQGANLIVGLVTSIVCGVCANSWYLSQAIRVVTSARAQGLDGEDLLHTLSKRGGTSPLAALAIVFFGLFALVAMAVALLQQAG